MQRLRRATHRLGVVLVLDLKPLPVHGEAALEGTLPLGQVLGLAALSVLFTTIWMIVLRNRLRRRRTLHHGQEVQGLVSEVEDTQTSVNGDKIYRLVLALGAEDQEGGTQTVEMNVKSKTASAARRVMREEEPVRLLVDPSVQGKCLWLDGWTLES